MAAVAALLLVAATALGAPDSVRSPSGDLDPSFAGDGTLAHDFYGSHDFARGVVVTRAGEIIAGVEAYRGAEVNERTSVLVRYRDDGSLAGVIGLPLRDLSDLVEVRDGKLLALGSARNGVAVVRVAADGTPDRGFGAEGLAVVPRRRFGRPECLNGLHVAATRDGGVLIAGIIGCGGEIGNSGTFVARLRADGSLDPSFANRGLRFMDDCASAGVAVRRDGKILIATGTGTEDYCYSGAMKVARLTSGGRPDRSFGRHGRVHVRFPGAGDHTPYAMVIDGRRRIIMAGAAGRHVGAARLTPAGRLDRSFGDDGLAIRRTRRRSYATAAAVAANGAITVTVSRQGDTGFWSTSGFIALRFAADGSPDPAFGARGLQEVSFGTETAEANDLALDAHGRTVVVGHAFSQQSTTTYDVAIARLR